MSADESKKAIPVYAWNNPVMMGVRFFCPPKIYPVKFRTAFSTLKPTQHLRHCMDWPGQHPFYHTVFMSQFEDSFKFSLLEKEKLRDKIQECGCLGLLKAVQRTDSEKSCHKKSCFLIFLTFKIK